jgi:Signal recognition particle GTPase
MGDIVSLVEKAAANIDAEKAMRSAERMRKGAFDLNDLRDQLDQMSKMGGIGGLMGMLPGVAKMKNQIAAPISTTTAQAAEGDDRFDDAERAAQSGPPEEQPQEAHRRRLRHQGRRLNKLLKMHRGMADMMKAMGSGAKRGPMAGLANMFGMGAGAPTPEQMAEMAKNMPAGGGLPPNMPKLPSNFPGMPGGLPGLGGLGKPPGPPGLPGLGKKK